MMFGGGGKGMGGGARGANMLRAVVGRTAVSGTGNPTSSLQETLPSSTSSASRRHSNNNSNGYLSVSASSSLGSYSNNSGVPISANSGLPSNWFVSPASSATPCFDDFEWVSVDAIEEDNKQQPHDFDFVLGPVPSIAEVQNAISAFQRVSGVSSCPPLTRDRFSHNAGREMTYPSPSSGSMHRVHSVGSELDWMEPSMQLYNTRAFQPYVSNSVYDAFHLLQTDPAIQKMVLSLSSDEVVWNAVLNNEVVRELRETYYAAEDSSPMSFDESSVEDSDQSDKTTNIVNWIFYNTKEKVLDLFEKLTKLVNELFKLPVDNDTKTPGTPDPFDQRLRTSFLLSVLVLLIVVVSRAKIT
ncbi:transmembrane protein [Gossypium australe]|uniref:Transmembrane protein n=1 Tax=Gossypium australe TaxID=47621 RepID=A0A5B6W382_9ROSI|nr:transmembrane protein [Gossypium australe]